LEKTDGKSSSLDAFFRPRSIALVGATNRSIWSVSAFDNLTRFGFAGPIHLINPKGGTIHGRTAAPSCAAVGEPIDAALVMVPESVLLDTFEDLQRAGIAGAVVLSSGFAETGEAGLARQQEMARRARQAGIRLIGPNCLGFANYVRKTPIWTTPLRRPMPNPALAIVSQSGALAGQMEQFAYQQRIALTHMVSTGNEADLTIADVIEYLAQQPEPRAIAVFLETVRDPPRFIAAVNAARASGKPVVVLKVGSSEAAAKAAQAHTGSLVGSDTAFSAVCRRLGIARVQSLEELIITADLFARLKDIPPGGLALLAMSGGLCEIATDQCEKLGIVLPALAAATLEELRGTLPPLATPANPLDLTGAAMLEPELIARSIAAVAKDPAVGLVAYVFDAPTKFDERGAARRFIEQVADGMSRIGKPGLMLSHAFTAVSGEGRAATDELGLIYSGSGIHGGLKALAHLLRQRAHREPPGTAPPIEAAPPARPVTERAALAHLAAHGVAVVPGTLAVAAAQAVDAAHGFGAPVALKISSPDIQHKTEAGGVMLDVSGDEAVAAAFARIVERVEAFRPTALIEGVLVSPMRAGGVELFVGTLRDPQWGPLIAVGLGGVWVEALKDTSLRLLPIDEHDVLEMLGELRGGALLDGFRGAPPVDRAAVAREVAAIGRAALALGSDLVAFEVNPLLASGGRIEALDALAIWDDPRSAA
jgi:acyl-CoA synthetase (NDP forming)